MHDCTTLPVTPGAIIGWRADGKPIRLIGGGSEPAPADPAPPAPEPPAAPAAAGEPAPPAPATAGTTDGDGGTAPQAGQPPGGPDSIDQLAQSWQKHIRELRSQAGEYRTKAKQATDTAKQATDALAAREAEYQARMDGIAKALNLLPEETTPEQIAAERDAARARADESAGHARAAAVELAVFRAASAMAVNPNALLDSRAFVSTLAGLDPAGDGFAEMVVEKITAAAEQNPAWKMTVAPAAPLVTPAAPPPLPGPSIPASGPAGSFTAAPAGARQLSVEETHGMSPSQVQDVINRGLLTDAGFGPKRSSRR